MGGLADPVEEAPVGRTLRCLRRFRLLSSREQVTNFLVHRLREVLVPVADGEKRVGYDSADDFVDFRFKLLAGFRRSRRDCEDNPGGLQLSQRHYCGAHRGPGGQAIIDQDHSPTTNLGRRTTATVEALAARQLLLLACRHRVDDIFRYAQTLNDLVVEDAYAAGCDRAHRQLFVSWDTQLAYDKDVEGCA
jgi:hypothetical protein